MSKLSNRRKLVQHIYRKDFAAFVRFVGRALFEEPIENWHIDVMSDAIAKCLQAPGGRLILNAPPRSFKSFVGSNAMPAFVLARNPKAQIMIVAGSQGLARSLQHRLHELVCSDGYRSLNPHVAVESAGTELKTANGGRVSYVVVGHRIMGRGADLIVIDDPQTSETAANTSEQEECLRWIRSDLLSRLDRKSQGQVFLIMQRLATGDLTDRLDDGEWRKVVLKAVADRQEVWRLSNGEEVIRGKHCALCPALEDVDVLYNQAMTIEASAFSTQYQQKPLAHNTRSGFYFTEDISKYEWTPEGPLPSAGMIIIPELRFISYEVFGIGDPPAEPYRQILTDEQWQISASIQQDRLIAACNESRL